MKRDTYSVISIIVAFLFVILLSFIPKSNYSKKLISEKNVNNSLKAISLSVGDNYTKIIDKELSSDIINIVYKDSENDDYKSFFIDKNSGEVLDYKSILKNKSEDDFDEIELKLLNEKYPKFIVEGIKNSKTKRDVFIKDNSLVVIYSNVETNPACFDKLSLIINFNEINNLLNFSHDLDEEYKNESGYDYDPTKKYIAFTFDDGPNRNNTNDIVNYLNDNKMKATFFMVGNLMANNPDIVKNVYDNNMEIGSHSWQHNNLRRQKIATIAEEMIKTDETYKNITGETITLMRPPYGAINNEVRDTFDYVYITWNVDTLDWKYKDPDRLYDYVTNNVNDGDIVLMHDLQDTTKVGIERILPELYVRGYRIVTVSELAKIKEKTLETKTIYRSMK